MGLFKDVFCVECGAKAKLLTRTRLGDGQYLCFNCTRMIPSYLTDCLSEFTYEQYAALKKYIEYSNNELDKVFHENHSFHSLHIDTEHGLFYLEDGYGSAPMYLKFSELADFNMVFSPEEYKEGILGDKVKGKILLKIKMNNPYFYYEKILASDVKANAKTTFFGSNIDYENPKGMDEFLLYFLAAWHDAILSNDDQEDCSDAPSELQQALALFMIDDLNGVTLEEIKEQRNRLIKTFHPDTNSSADTKYAQKINAAYEVIKKYLS